MLGRKTYFYAVAVVANDLHGNAGGGGPVLGSSRKRWYQRQPWLSGGPNLGIQSEMIGGFVVSRLTTALIV